MTDSQKKEIQLLLKNYVAQYPSQAKASATLKNVSEATIIAILKDKWDGISVAMWRNVGKQVGFSNKGKWQMVETKDFQTLVYYFEDAQEYSNVFAITANSGSGKSFTAEWYAAHKPNVYHLVCAEYFNRKMFLSKLLEKMGKDNTGYNVSEMMDCIVETLMKQESPLIILDEADKLNDQVLYFFITLYNMLRGKCGIVMMATEYLNKRISRGRRLNRKGYSEIYSRIGRRFITLSGTTKEEVKDICTANGISDPARIVHIYNEYDGDLRRVERAVHKARVSTSAKKAA